VTPPLPVPLLACFGVACPRHHRCARYAAVTDPRGDSSPIGTCLKDAAYPMFIEIVAARPT
jgi:hypothetical protein